MVAQEADDLREERHVRSGVAGQTDRVGVLLDRGLGDLLGCLVQAGVDDLEPRVAQAPSDHLDPAVVTVEAGFRDDDPVLAGHAAASLAKRPR